MKLWLLRPVEGLLPSDDPWAPWYDTANGFVVRAESEEAARKVAAKNAGCERFKAWGKGGVQHLTPWLEPKYSTCAELVAEGSEEMILRDFWSA